MPEPRDDFVDFVPRKLSTFSGLGTLRHLDLKFVGIDEIICCHAEAGRRYLFYRTPPEIAIRIRLESFFVFPALARVRLTANAIHGDGQRFVGFLADRTK